MLNRFICSVAVLAAALVPAGLSAQAARTSPVPSYHLMQLSVDSTDVTFEEFKAKTEAIRSCGDATKLVESLGTEWKRDRFVRASQLPEDLQAVLEELPTGHATQVFSDDGIVLRVIVLCNRA